MKRIGAFALALSLSACSADEEADDGPCNTKVASHAIEGASHVADCSAVSYGTNPPNSGPHYFTWAAFGVYEEPLPRGFWVHAMEHGTVVVSYNCPDGCADDVEKAKTFAESVNDPDCSPARVILTPDPLLDTEWAASAWGHTLRASCVDSERLESFYAKHVGQAPERVCASGSDFRLPDGTLDLPAGCGTAP